MPGTPSLPDRNKSSSALGMTFLITHFKDITLVSSPTDKQVKRSGVSLGISINGCKIPNKLWGFSIDGCKLPLKPLFNKNWWVQIDLFLNWWVQMHPLNYPNDAPEDYLLIYCGYKSVGFMYISLRLETYTATLIPIWKKFSTATTCSVLHKD